MSSYAQYRAATAEAEELLVKHERERQQADAKVQAALPFLGDDIFVLIAAELDARMLGRLGCAAQRFWRASVPDPAHTAEDAAPPELWSVAEEGARRGRAGVGLGVAGGSGGGQTPPPCRC